MADNSKHLIPAKPGEVRNPNGRGKGTRNRSTIMREWLEMETDGEPNLNKILRALINKASEGDVPAIREALDSAFGKVTDKQEITNPDGSMTPQTITVKVVTKDN